jgi:hypothetical protein
MDKDQSELNRILPKIEELVEKAETLHKELYSHIRSSSSNTALKYAFMLYKFGAQDRAVG